MQKYSEKTVKNYIRALLCILSFICLTMGYRIYATKMTQIITVRAISEGALGNDKAISDTMHIETVSVPEKIGSKNNLVPGLEYQIIVEYDLISKTGNGLFAKGAVKQQNPVYLKCTKLQTKQTFTARNKFLSIDLALTVDPAELVDKDGKTFNPKTMKLVPRIELKEKP